MAKRNRASKKSKEPEVIVTDEGEEQVVQQEPTLAEFVQQEHQEVVTADPNELNADWFKAEFDSKSAAIRYCKETLKWDVKKTSKQLGIRYQMVRNIWNNVPKRGANEPSIPKSERPQTVQTVPTSLSNRDTTGSSS